VSTEEREKLKKKVDRQMTKEKEKSDSNQSGQRK
jgi:hypothetical protein